MRDADNEKSSGVPAWLSLYPVDLKKSFSPVTVFGLPLLYASSFYLPTVSSLGAYFLPSRDLWHLVIMPSALAVGVGSILVSTLLAVVRRWASPRVATVCAVLCLAFFSLIAFKGVVYAAGYDWRKLFGGDEALNVLRYFKYSGFLAAFALIWLNSRRIAKFNRMLGSLGLAFGVFAAIQLAFIWKGDPGGASLSSNALPHISIPGPDLAARRVVWVIFDETDFGRTYSSQRDTDFTLGHFDWLAHRAAFAEDARSPASGTLYSLPALLSGTPMIDKGIRIDGRGTLSEDIAGGHSLPFVQATSVFSRLSEAQLSSSILGFYHPYCRLFSVRRCDSFAVSEVVGLDAALVANVPDALFPAIKNTNIWESITAGSLALLPQYVERDDALTFIHLNIPHPPARYADRVLNLPASDDPLKEYAHNLVLADRVLGQIIAGVQHQSARRKILLIVSTDHWLRNIWYQPTMFEESRKVPFMVWTVGTDQGVSMTEPLSTVHTAAMVLDYLSGKISTEVDVAEWWKHQSVSASFIAPSS